MWSIRFAPNCWPKLAKDVTSQEIRLSFFSMNDNKAPGLDGFTVNFFHQAWDVVGLDFIVVYVISFS